MPPVWRPQEFSFKSELPPVKRRRLPSSIIKMSSRGKTPARLWRGVTRDLQNGTAGEAPDPVGGFILKILRFALPPLSGPLRGG